MMDPETRNERGMTLALVLIVILLMSAIGVVIMSGVDRNSEMRGTFQKTVAGFQAAEAGINVGADAVMNKMGNNIQPSGSDCSANFGGSPLSLNGLTVSYTLSGCGQSSTLQTLPADDPFAGLSAYVYTYTLTSTAVDSSGFTEGNLKMQFYARQWPGWSNGNVSTYRLQDEYSTCGQNGVGGCTVNGWMPSPYPPGSPGGVPATTTYSNHAALIGSDPTWCPTDHTGATCASLWSGPGSGGFDESWTGQQYWFITAGATLDTSHHTCYAYLTGINPTNDPSFSCNTYTAQGFNTRRYAPPTRLGFYDTSFNTPGNLPPVTPFFVSLRQVLFTEPFQ